MKELLKVECCFFHLQDAQTNKKRPIDRSQERRECVLPGREHFFSGIMTGYVLRQSSYN